MMYRMLVAVVSLYLAISALAMAEGKGASEHSSAISLTPCNVEGVQGAVRCGVLEVPENREQPNGRRIALNIVVVPAMGHEARRDPIVALLGGPGEDAVSAAADYAERFAALRRERDILFVDQRGTGRSGGLQCDMYSPGEDAANLRDFFPIAAVQRCERQLCSRADLTQYSYSHFATDLEHVRRTLGYEQLNLFAGSYGTRAAQVYLRAHPRSVRTAFLGSVVPIDIAIPLPLAKAAQIALDQTLAACAADSACHAAFPNIRDEFREVLSRLDSGVLVQISTSSTAVPLDRGRVAEWLRARLYRAETASLVPWLIHRAYVGDWSPIVDGILSDARKRVSTDPAFSFGVFFSIACNEDVALIREQEVAPASREAFLGDYRVRQQQAACKNWPKVSVPGNYREPVHSSVPTLFVSGDSDPASPLWFTEHIAHGFSNRAEVVLRGQGHTEWNDCVGRLYEQFVQAASVRELNTSCEPMPRPPFKTR
jgi:pimeloyl-ACP methyl ester carboxylesterase